MGVAAAPQIGLNIGCGALRYESTSECAWVNIDCINDREPPPDLLCDVGRECLPYPEGFADYCVLHHLYEHLDAPEGHALVEECYRVLKPGGKLIVTVPDMRALAQRWLTNQLSDDLYFVNVYGPYQGKESDRHKRGFDGRLLIQDLKECGAWTDVRRYSWVMPVPGADIKRDWWILGVEAIK